MSAEGLDLSSFRTEVLRSLRSSVSIDAAFFATVDPTTLLFTSALAEEPLASVTAQFLDNEYGRNDVNKFAQPRGIRRQGGFIGWGHPRPSNC